MDIFKTQEVKTGDTSTTTKQPNTPPAGKETLSANPPSTGPDGKMPGTNPADQNPLDAYSKMFDNASNNSEVQAPNFSLDPKVLNDVSRKMDFTRGVNPDTLQKATTGDVNALMDIIKQVGQNSYRAAIEHGTALTDSHLKQRGDFESKKLERGVNKKLTESALSTAPNYSHPVVKAELNRIASQIAAANPDASPQQVAQSAQQYLNDLYGALNPQAGKPKGKENEAETDWSKYLSGE
jgi:hypothetical protein